MLSAKSADWGAFAIKKVIVINLDKHGDPIYAGMETSELVLNLVILIKQMDQSEGHFIILSGMQPATIGERH